MQLKTLMYEPSRESRACLTLYSDAQRALPTAVPLDMARDLESRQKGMLISRNVCADVPHLQPFASRSRSRLLTSALHSLRRISSILWNRFGCACSCFMPSSETD